MDSKGQEGTQQARVATSYMLLLVHCVAVWEAIDRHIVSIFKAQTQTLITLATAVFSQSRQPLHLTSGQ